MIITSIYSCGPSYYVHFYSVAAQRTQPQLPCFFLHRKQQLNYSSASHSCRKNRIVTKRKMMPNAETCYYSVLGICKKASASEVRDAYRKQALKWHPDRWVKNRTVAAEAKRKFQQIQEAYSVLSDQAKRAIYDAGLFSLLSEDDDDGFVGFMQEMALMMKSTKPKAASLEELRGLLVDMMGGDGSVENNNCLHQCTGTSQQSAKRRRFT